MNAMPDNQDNAVVTSEAPADPPLSADERLNSISDRLQPLAGRLAELNQRRMVAEATIAAHSESLTAAYDALGDLQKIYRPPPPSHRAAPKPVAADPEPAAAEPEAPVEPQPTDDERLAAISGGLGSLAERLEILNQKRLVAEATIAAHSESLTAAYDALGELQKRHAEKTIAAAAAAPTPQAPAMSEDLAPTPEAAATTSPPSAQPEEAPAGVTDPAAAPQPVADEPDATAGTIFWQRCTRPEQPFIYTHIPKCAGTTFNLGIAHLARETQGRKLSLVGASSRLAAAENIRQMCAVHDFDLDDFKFVVGHAPFSVFRDRAADHNFVVSVRDPIDRALSDICSQPTFLNNPEYAYIEILEAERTSADNIEYLIDNIHVRMLCNDPNFGNRCTSKMLREAMENLERHYTVVFSARNTGRALDELCDLMGVGRIAVDAQNVTEQKPESVPQDVIDSLRELNRLDLELLDRLRNKSSGAPQADSAPPGSENPTHLQADSFVSVDDPRVPADWRETAPDIILELDGSASVRLSWINSQSTQ